MAALRLILAFLAAVMVTAALSAIAQTQFNLAALQELGLPMPLAVRLRTTVADLAGFSPLYAGVTAVALGTAFPVAALLARLLPRARAFLFALAGGTGIFTALAIMNQLLGLTVIAAARSSLGLASLILAGALGGLVFARLLSAPRATGNGAPTVPMRPGG